MDISKLRPGTKIRVKDGSVLFVKGMYMSPDGPVVTAVEGPGKLCARNVPAKDVVEIVVPANGGE